MSFKPGVFSRLPAIVVVSYLGLYLLAGCVAPGAPPPATQSAPATQSSSVLTPSPVWTPMALPTPSPAIVDTPALEIQPLNPLCSAFNGVPVDGVEDMLSNPYNPPPMGSDGPHQGVDLADIDPQRVARSGRQVSALLSGRVAAVIRDRFPYGNALLVETTLASLPEEWVGQLELPLPGLPRQGNPVLTCPALDVEPDWDEESQSLYLLYAHLEQAPELQTGDTVTCGGVIGTIGSSGNALNPHLHLETRVGPEGASFASMAHYDASASLDEMAAYCAWRVGGRFQHFDPMRLFVAYP